MPKKQLLKLIYFLLFSVILSVSASGGRSDAAVTVSADGYIKWVDFNATAEIMRAALKCDIDTCESSKNGEGHHADFVTLIALTATKYGGEFGKAKTADITAFSELLASGRSAAEIAETLPQSGKYFPYFLEAYGAVLDGFVGEYTADENGTQRLRYGLKVFSPIAAGYYYSDFDDFGASRSYGYSRRHLGHDMMGSVGTPIVAVESGYIEACGWNRYGGWRIGIRSYDGKRYYYYAHLRRGHPFADMYEGKHVTAGEVIGYLGMTGYSSKEDVNNIDTPHLHFGVQLIFDQSQKDGTNQIWIDLYEYTKFLSKYRSAVAYDKESGEFFAVSPITDLSSPD